MKRILSLILALLLAACGVFTAYAEDSESGRPPQPGGSAPEGMGAPPDLPDGEMPGGPGGTPPEGGPGGTPPAPLR